MSRLLAVLLCLLPLETALAWGELGHRLVGELAERRLSPQARAQVHELLADEFEPSLAGVASWADAIRELPTHRWTASLHYVSIRDSACRFKRARDCRGDNCVVGAIERYARKLGDTTLVRSERAEALKFLVHFVGDVHQPLHTGHRPDKGGNDFQVSLGRREPPRYPPNLHSIWDHYLLGSANEDESRHAARLQALMPPQSTAPVDIGNEAARWAESSCLLTDSPGFYPQRPGKLPPDYLERMRPLADARLQLAASRLAQVIETALAPRP